MHLRDLLPRRSPAAAPAVVNCPHLEPDEDPDPDGCVLCVLDDLLGCGGELSEAVGGRPSMSHRRR